jgi:hypothetical protein
VVYNGSLIHPTSLVQRSVAAMEEFSRQSSFVKAWDFPKSIWKEMHKG